MKKLIKSAVVGLALVGGISAAYAEGVDTSVEGIFNALTSSANLQATVDVWLQVVRIHNPSSLLLLRPVFHSTRLSNCKSAQILPLLMQLY